MISFMIFFLINEKCQHHNKTNVDNEKPPLMEKNPSPKTITASISSATIAQS